MFVYSRLAEQVKLRICILKHQDMCRVGSYVFFNVIAVTSAARPKKPKDRKLKSRNFMFRRFVLSVLATAFVFPVALVAENTEFVLSQIGEAVPENSLAQVVSPRRSDIAAEIDGIVTDISVLEAQRVNVGDTLVSFDCRSHKMSLARAQLALEMSEQTAKQTGVSLARSNELLSNKSVSQANNDVAQLAFDTAILEVRDRTITRDVNALTASFCEVTAPFTGVISKIVAGPGSYLTAGSHVLSMFETEDLRIVAQLTPEEIDILGTGVNPAFISGDEHFEVSNPVVEPLFDPILGTQRVIYSLPSDADLPVGLTGVLRWNGERFTLPSSFFVRRGPDVGLLIGRDNKQTFYPVPGSIEGLPIVVRLPADTKVYKP